MAYREHEDLAMRLRDARAVLEDLTQCPLELWDSDPATTRTDVRRILDQASIEADIQVPDRPSLWPWCDPKKQKTCIMPAVLFGAFAALTLEHESKSLADLIAQHSIDTGRDPWALLAQVGRLVGSAMDADVPTLRDHLDAKWRAEIGTPAPGRFIAELSMNGAGSGKELVAGIRATAGPACPGV